MAKKERVLPLDKPIPLPKGEVTVVKPLGEAKALAFGVPVGTSIVSDKDPLADTKSGVTPAAYAQMRAGVIPVVEEIDPRDEQLAANARTIEELKVRISKLEAGQTPPPAPATGGIESLTAADTLGKRKLEAAGHSEKQTKPDVDELVNDKVADAVRAEQDKEPTRRPQPRTVPRDTLQMSKAEAEKLEKKPSDRK